MKLNNKGFTLVEVLAVVVILSILIAIMVPSVNYIINKNKEDNYKNLEASIISATKVYLSDNRYNITLDYGIKLCDTSEESIANIAGNIITDNKLPIRLLIDSKNLSTDSEGRIINPKNYDEYLDVETNNTLEESYVIIKYQCSNKNYTYTLEENSLIWKEK